MTRRLPRARLTLLSFIGLVSCSRTPVPAQQESNPTAVVPSKEDPSVYCPVGSHESLTVTEHGFAQLSFDSSPAALKHQCPAARDTVLVGYEGEATALILHFHGASLFVYHDSDSMHKPSDFWNVEGDSVRLPHGLTLRSSWADFRAAYGPQLAIAADAPNNDTEWVSFGFCSMPHLTFEFPLLAEQAITDTGYGDVPADSVPSHPHVTSVGVEKTEELWLTKHCPERLLPN